VRALAAQGWPVAHGGAARDADPRADRGDRPAEAQAAGGGQPRVAEAGGGES